MAESHKVRVVVVHDHPAFAGHFPGRPLLPGVTLLAWVLEALLADAPTAARLGVAPLLNTVKFLAPVGPGAALDIRWTLPAAGARVRFEVWRLALPDDTPSATRGDAVDHAPADVLAASGQFEAGAT